MDLRPQKTYDKAKWHADGATPGVSSRQGFVHIAMYLTWAITRGVHNAPFFAELPQGSQNLDLIFRKKRTATTMREALDGSLPSEALSPVGRAFTDWYYGEPEAIYLDDWVSEFGDEADHYRVADSWETFERIAKRVDEQFRLWQQRGESSETVSTGGMVAPSIDPASPELSSLDAARDAIQAAGGTVVPGPVARLRDRLAGGLSADEIRGLAIDIGSGSVVRRRNAVTKLAAAPLTSETVEILSRAARSSDAVVAAIASHAIDQKS